MNIAGAHGVSATAPGGEETGVQRRDGGRRRVRVLVADDDVIAARSLAEFLENEGYEAGAVNDAREALRVIQQAEEGETEEEARPVQVVLADVSMPGMGGMELLEAVVRKHPRTAVVMVTGYGTVESAVRALKLGAADYLTKPIVDAELGVAMERALRQQALQEENATLRGRIEDRFALESVVGTDYRMQRVYEMVRAAAPSRTTVLMTGESGTGKSLIARAIHRLSARRDKPFVELSCGSIPETLLESELFGHVKGAFTGAHADKVGRFLAADGGTLFLDEINSASPGMQLKLLRVLQEKRFEPVGSTQTIEVDVRVLLASNQPLERLVSEGVFRQDLYYRINVVKIELPPLRERVGDIPALAGRFLSQHGLELGKTLTGFSPEAVEALCRYPYPGNVRELSNIVERAAVLTRTPTIGVEDLPEHVVRGESGLTAAFAGGAGERGKGGSAGGGVDGEREHVPMSLEEALKEPERRIILEALEANGWNRQQTADELGINRTTLYKKMKVLGIGER